MDMQTKKLLVTIRDELEKKLSLPRVRRKLKFEEVPGKINVAVGMRRSGKTFFLFQTIAELMAGGVSREHILYINFEDDRLAPLSSAGAAGIIEAFYSLFPANHNQTCHLFLDEVHNVPDWHLLVRRLFDTKDVRLYLTGSSSKILSTEIATSLRGRAISTEIWPFCFEEYLHAMGESLPNGGPLPRRIADSLNLRLMDYLQTGGFPEVVTLNPLNRVRILQDYVEVVILRDVVERHGLTNTWLARYVALTMVRGAGKRFTANKLHKDLQSQGLKVAKNTLYALLDHYQDAYLAFVIPLWSDSLRKVQTNPRKLYAVDTGLAGAVNPDFSPNLGQMFENLIYLDLRRQGYDVYYYLTKNRREVDFYALDPLGKERLLQVCFDIRDPATAARERSALEEGEKELGIKGELITLDSYLNAAVE